MIIPNRFPRSLTKQKELLDYIETLFPGLSDEYTAIDKWWIFKHNKEPTRCPCGNVVHVSSDGFSFNKYCSLECARQHNTGALGKGFRLPCNVNEFVNICVASDFKIQTVAKHFDVSRPVTERWFREYDIHSLKEKRDKEWYNTIAQNTTLNCHQLAKLLNTTPTKIKLFCDKQQIHLVDYVELKRKEAIQILDDNVSLFSTLTLQEISHKLGVHYERVKEYRRVNDLPIIIKNKPYSKKEKELLSFVKEYYPSAGSRKHTIDGKVYEVDIMIPELSLGIEFNGCWFHSSFNIDKNYHQNKTNSFARNNIQLIHIWENDWETKRDIVKSIIASKLGKSKRLYARKCDIREVGKHDADEFFDATHLKGHGKSGINYGLYYNSELVMCMRFARHTKYGWELLRMSSKLNTTVVGGMSRILKHFIKQHNPKSIMSYVDRDISNGKSYYAVGFDLLTVTEPSYWYVDSKYQTHCRQKFQSHKTGVNEEQYTKNLKLNRIHNSGNLKMILEL